jgi:uncharacterized protein YutE (UPF0331/DUF86 family)
VTPAPLLETKIKQRALDVRRQLDALAHALEGFGSVDAFEAAWQTDDPEGLNRANALQAGYENVINGCVTIAQELCELEGWAPADSTAPHVLKLLHDNGVITGKTRQELKDAQERRSDVQHDYVGVAAQVVYSEAQDVIEHAPLLLQGVADQLRQRQ